MLTYFPMPYPDEWWYSVLCRYHVRSGRPRTSNTWHELYGDPKRFILHERLFPNASCSIITRQIPFDILLLEDILCKHTLLLYYIRFHPMQQKNKVWNHLLAGNRGDVNIVRPQTPEGKQGLKFCPVCYTEDTKNYGEPYWHREHQIPLMPLCPKHGCRLHLVETDISKLEKEFLPLSKAVNAKTITQDSDCCSWEQALTNALFSILTLPFEVGPTDGYNNLENALKSDKFTVHLGRKETLYGEKLHQWCVQFYGQTISEHYLSTMTFGFLHSLFQWKIYVPEQYALLCVLVNLTIKDLLGPEIYELDFAKEKLMEYKNSDVVYKKYELAKLLGISEKTLNFLIKKCHIEPFWDITSARRKYLHIKVSKEEKQRILDAIYTKFAPERNRSGRKTNEAIRNIVMQKAEKVIFEYENTNQT